eukprot:04700_3
MRPASSVCEALICNIDGGTRRQNIQRFKRRQSGAYESRITVSHSHVLAIYLSIYLSTHNALHPIYLNIYVRHSPVLSASWKVTSPKLAFRADSSFAASSKCPLKSRWSLVFKLSTCASCKFAQMLPSCSNKLSNRSDSWSIVLVPTTAATTAP